MLVVCMQRAAREEERGIQQRCCIFIFVCTGIVDGRIAEPDWSFRAASAAHVDEYVSE